MYVMSEHIQGPLIQADWPGLNSNFLDNGDLSITVDYRDVLGEILSRRTAGTDLAAVFPDHAFSAVNVIT